MLKHFQVCSVITTLCAGALFASDQVEELNSLETQASFEQVSFRGNSSGTTLAAASNQKATSSTKSSKVMPSNPNEMLPTHSCPKAWRISGDFLYLLPTLDDTYFVLTAPTSATVPSGTIRDNAFGFAPGFRAGAEYACCDNERAAQAFYSWLSTDQTHTVSGSNLWATVGSPDMASTLEHYTGSAKSHLDLLYQRLDTSFSQQLLNAHGFCVYVQPGLEWAYLRLNENYTFTNVAAVSTLHERSKILGVGPQLGLGMDYDFYRKASVDGTMTHAISFAGLFSGSIIMGQSQIEYNEVRSGGSSINVSDSKTWRTIPALHARLGLNYTLYTDSVGFALGAGYEFNTYFRGLSRIVFVDDTADGLSINNYDDFDIQGLYVSAGLSF